MTTAIEIPAPLIQGGAETFLLFLGQQLMIQATKRSADELNKNFLSSTTMMLTLKTAQMCIAALLIVIESLGILLWLVYPDWLIPWPVSKEIINNGFCKASRKNIIVNITIQVNPMAHFFSGAIPRMMNG